MSGLNPNVIRSYGVKKCRRFVLGSAFGPSAGSFAVVAARVRAHRHVTPSVRSVKPYAPVMLIGPVTLLTEIVADSFSSASTWNCSTTGCLNHFAFVHLYVDVSPCSSGKKLKSGGGSCGV